MGCNPIFDKSPSWYCSKCAISDIPVWLVIILPLFFQFPDSWICSFSFLSWLRFMVFSLCGLVGAWVRAPAWLAGALVFGVGSGTADERAAYRVGQCPPGAVDRGVDVRCGHRGFPRGVVGDVAAFDAVGGVPAVREPVHLRFLDGVRHGRSASWS